MRRNEILQYAVGIEALIRLLSLTFGNQSEGIYRCKARLNVASEGGEPLGSNLVHLQHAKALLIDVTSSSL